MLKHNITLQRGDKASVSFPPIPGDHTARKLIFVMKAGAELTDSRLISKKNTVAGGAATQLKTTLSGSKTGIVVYFSKTDTEALAVKRYPYDITSESETDAEDHYTIASGEVTLNRDIQTPYDSTGDPSVTSCAIVEASGVAENDLLQAKTVNGARRWVNVTPTAFTDNILTAIQGQANITDITYSNLASKAGSESLVPGRFYRITDFATTHYYMDGDTTLADTNTGPTEPLIVYATSESTLHMQALSALYPQDIIYYDWNPDNWTADRSFSSGGIIIPGFKGVITFRHDTEMDVSCWFDWRNCKTRFWEHSSYGVGVTGSTNGGPLLGDYKLLQAAPSFRVHIALRNDSYTILPQSTFGDECYDNEICGSFGNNWIPAPFNSNHIIANMTNTAFGPSTGFSHNTVNAVINNCVFSGGMGIENTTFNSNITGLCIADEGLPIFGPISAIVMCDDSLTIRVMYVDSGTSLFSSAVLLGVV